MNVYVALTTEKDGKYYSWVSEFRTGTNLKAEWCFYDNDIVTITMFKTKREAEATVKCWNDNWKRNGKLL